MSDSNMQYVTSTSFLLLTYAKYLTSASKVVMCGGTAITPKRLRAIAKRQVNLLGSYQTYILFALKVKQTSVVNIWLILLFRWTTYWETTL